MAQYIWYKGKLWPYDLLLEELDRGVHFAILPDGQIVKHAEHTEVMWHARGANTRSVGVELIVPGVYDLAGLYRKIDGQPSMAYDVYTRMQYQALMLLQGYLASYSFLADPRIDWTLHSVQSYGRKRDPGSAFSVSTFKEKISGYFI